MNKGLSESSILQKNEGDTDKTDAADAADAADTADSSANSANGAADGKTSTAKTVDKTVDKGADGDLVRRARKGDADAFKVLFQRYHRRAYSLALGVVRNPDDALDVVQDAFIKAHRYLDRFKGTSSFYTWLYRIVMNLSIDHLRKHKRNRHVDWTDAVGSDEGNTIAGESLLPHILGQNPGKSAVRKELREEISKAMNELSENHRAVLIMREIDGLSYEEMAQAMGCSKGTIMSRLFHARKNMQKSLLEYMGGEKDLKA